MPQYIRPNFFNNASRLGCDLFGNQASLVSLKWMKSLWSIYNDRRHFNAGQPAVIFPNADKTLFRGISSAELQFIDKFGRVGHEKRPSEYLPINWPGYVEKNDCDFLVSFTQTPQQALNYARLNVMPDISAVIQTHMPLLSVDVANLARFVPELFRTYDASDKSGGEICCRSYPSSYKHASNQREVVAINFLHGMDLRLQSDRIISLALVLSHGRVASNFLSDTHLRDENNNGLFTNSDHQANALHFSVVDLSTYYYEIFNHNAKEEGIFSADERMLHLSDITKRVLEAVSTLRSSDASQKVSVVPAKLELGSAAVEAYLLDIINECKKESSCSIARLG